MLFNKILRTNKMLDQWRRSVVVPIYKNKEDIQSCTSYRGIKFESYYETTRILRQETKISEN